jgi:ATP-binding cassette subfamily B protein
MSAAADRRGTWRVLAPCARRHRSQLGGAAALAVVESAVDLARPWPLAFAVDSAIGGRPVSGVLGGISPTGLLIVAGAALLLLSLVGGLAAYGVTLLAERGAERIGADVREATFGAAVRLPMSFHDEHRSGELVSRLTSDIGRVLDAVVAVATTALPDVVLVGGVLVMLAYLDPATLLPAVVVIPVLAGAAVVQRRRLQAAHQHARFEAGAMAATGTDLLRHVEVIKVLGRERLARRRFGSQSSATLDAEIAAVEAEARWTPVADVVLAVGTALVLVTAGRRVLAGSMTTGTLLAVVAYVAALYSPVRSLARLSTTLAKASASAARLSEVLDASDELADAPDAVAAPAQPRQLRLRDVSFAHRGGHAQLERVELVVPAGQIVCIAGPSGTGKTTLLTLVARLRDVDGGAIELDGIDVRRCSRLSLRRTIAYLPQTPWMLDGSIADNIALGAERPGRRAVLAAGRRALVDEFALALPDGYDTQVGEAGSRLSGGQRQRVALARVLLADAPMLLLDEPTAALDAVSKRLVIEAITATAVGRTVLVASHDPAVEAIAGRVVVLRAGHLVDLGRPSSRNPEGGECHALQTDAAHQGPRRPPTRSQPFAEPLTQPLP